MAKAALLAMTRSLARELAPAVRVNAVSPGAILWPETAEAQGEATDDAELDAQRQKIIAGIPLGRTGSPGDIAATCLFLATQAHYMTGQNLHVDGGKHIA